MKSKKSSDDDFAILKPKIWEPGLNSNTPPHGMYALNQAADAKRAWEELAARELRRELHLVHRLSGQRGGLDQDDLAARV